MKNRPIALAVLISALILLSSLTLQQLSTTFTYSLRELWASSINLIIGYVSGLLTIGTPYAFQKLRYWRNSKRPFVGFWGPMFEEGLSIITAVEDREKEVKSQVFDFMALSEATREFDAYFKNKYKVETCDNVSHDTLRKNLLLVGGPIPNTLTSHVHQEMLKRAMMKYGFRIDKDPRSLGTIEGNDIISLSDSTFVREAKFVNDTVVEDYGIITRCPNPFNEKRHVVIVEGCYGWGTWASLLSLLNPRNLEFLRSKEHFQVLVSVKLYNRIPGHASLERKTLVGIAGGRKK